MKRILLLAATLAAFGCAEIRDLKSNSNKDPYANPFYAKYLNTGSPLDARISRTLDAIRQDPKSSGLHNELGALLVEKGFPKDAEKEFERSVDLDKHNYAAWYNLGLIRAARGDEGGARRAFMFTVHYKPGHAAALFQLGLVEEKLKHTDRAVDLYAKAFRINPTLLEVEVNPRILDTKLVHLAMLKAYPMVHARDSMPFQGVAATYGIRKAAPAAAPPAQPQTIVPPSTTPATEAAPAPTTPPQSPRRRRQPQPNPPSNQ